MNDQTDLVLALHKKARLCVHDDEAQAREPRITRSLGIKADEECAQP